MWPGDGAPLVDSAAVLRVGGDDPTTRCCFGEDDVAGAYRKLSRAVHPDKTRGIPNSDDAFKRLKDAGDELREDTKAARATVRQMEGLLGDSPVDDEALRRPHAVLFATTLRFLSSVVGLKGEGQCKDKHRRRAAASFRLVVATQGVDGSAAVKAWSEKEEMLDAIGTQTLRHAYECAPKHYRAQLLCAISRLAWLEETPGEIFRPEWQDVLVLFPELRTWRRLEMQIRERTWSDKSSRRRRRSSSSSSSSRRRRRRSRSRSRSRGRGGPAAEDLSAVAAMFAALASQPDRLVPRSMGVKAAATAAATATAAPAGEDAEAMAPPPADFAPASAEATAEGWTGASEASTAERAAETEGTAPRQSWGEGDEDNFQKSSRRSKWGADQGDAGGDRSRDDEFAKMEEEMFLDARARAKSDAEAKAKAKGGGKRQENELGSRWVLTRWAEGWRERIMKLLPHADDGCMPFNASPLRSLVMELWEDVAKQASGAGRDALSLFKCESTDIRWAFVPAADLLLTVGEGIVGVTFEGAYILDARKMRAGGVWVNLSLASGTRVYSEAKRLVDEFGIDDPQVVAKLLDHLESRRASRRRDVDDFRGALRGAQNPAAAAATLGAKLRELAQPKGGAPVDSGGKGARVPAGRAVTTAGGGIKIKGVTFAPGAFTKGAQQAQIGKGGNQGRSNPRQF